MELGKKKVYEKPDAGQFLGTIIDVVDLPNKSTQYGPRDKVRFFWVLATLDGKLVLDKENKPMFVMREFSAYISDTSKLYEFLGTALGAAPPVLNNTDEIASLMIGRSNFLFLTKTPNPKNPGDFYVNIAGIGPVPQGAVPPAIPADYVRFKNRVKKQFVGATPQNFVQPQAPASPAPAPVAPTAAAVGPAPAYRSF